MSKGVVSQFDLYKATLISRGLVMPRYEASQKAENSRQLKSFRFLLRRNDKTRMIEDQTETLPAKVAIL